MVYVDDVMLTGTSISYIDSIKLLLDDKFKIKDFGSLKYIVGLELARPHKCIILNQRKYDLDIFNDTRLLAAKLCYTPLGMDYHKLHDPNLIPYHYPSEYKRLVGKLLYLRTTRPDMCFAFQFIS